ncbi:MAG: glycosyltransferase family 2 protein [Bacteroidales bacterium]|nr:glycosyltransferase family 2 protein [Bacteroidales bacterium]
MTDSNNKIFIVLVLYKQKLVESISFQSLQKHIDDLHMDYQLFVYNNSPESNAFDGIDDPNIVTFNAQSNQKLLGAYNEALKRAQNEGFNWILLLDQDSELNKEYFVQINEHIANIGDKVAALVPHTSHKGTHISPSEYSSFAGPFGRITPYSGKLSTHKYLSGINSCTVLRTEAITDIGGFSPEFTLDCMDFMYFYQLYIKGWKVQPINVEIEHELSILSLNDMGLERYTDYMKACAKFAKETKTSISVAFKIRTILRSIKMLFIPSKWKFILPTFSAIFINE